MKNYKQNVGNVSVQQVFAAKSHYDATIAGVVAFCNMVNNIFI
tara:strand:- start:24 stop:152 length:129 start_codon:yes stop_codon:yes gene_type:complete